jgi:hypothetical protein
MTNKGGEEKNEKSNKQGEWTLILELIDMTNYSVLGWFSRVEICLLLIWICVIHILLLELWNHGVHLHI